MDVFVCMFGGIFLLTLGIKGELDYTVQKKDTYKSQELGNLDVLSTSSMICFMESTVCKSLEDYLEKGLTTVGKTMNIQHFCPTPVGTRVKFESELVKIDGKNLTFEVKAKDPFGAMGAGIHERMIADSQYLTMKAFVKKVE